MINFYSETEFSLANADSISNWISAIVVSEGYELGDISYIFCDDSYLLKLNSQFLKHDTLTDIISFDYSVGKELNGEIYISIERVKENALEYDELFIDELHRVIIHGILHYCGYKDKEEEDATLMRKKENEALAILKTL